MLVLGIISLMTAVALPNINISPILLIRVASIILLYTAALSFNAMNIQAIGLSVGEWDRLSYVVATQAMITFIFLIGAMILIPWVSYTKQSTYRILLVVMSVATTFAFSYEILLLSNYFVKMLSWLFLSYPVLFSLPSLVVSMLFVYIVRKLIYSLLLYILVVIYDRRRIISSWQALNRVSAFYLHFSILWLVAVIYSYMVYGNSLTFMLLVYLKGATSRDILHSLLTVLFRPVLCDSNIPWAITDKVSQAQLVLNNMYNHLINDCTDDEASFARQYLAEYIIPPIGDTGLNETFISSRSMVEHSIRHRVSDRYACSSIGDSYHQKAVIYSFTNSSFDLSATYIGQTQNLTNRLIRHYNSSVGINRPIGKLYPYANSVGGLGNMLLYVNLEFSTFQDLWLKTHRSLSVELKYILQAFTEYKLALYEQALITYYKPQLNSSDVNFNFLHWFPGYARPNVAYSYFNVFDTKNLMESIKDGPKFDFSLYHNYTTERGIKPLDHDWLVWFIGFCERRANYASFGHTNQLIMAMKELDFLNYISDQLNLRSRPIVRRKRGHQLIMTGMGDRDCLSTIFYKNLVTQKFIDTVRQFTANSNNRVDLSMTPKGVSAASLDNSWLSGIIDAHSSFFFDKGIPVVSFNLSKHPEILLCLLSVFSAATTRKYDNTIAQFRGDNRVAQLMRYLTKYPLKYNKATQRWFESCLKLRALGYHRKAETKQSFIDLVKSRPNI